MGLFHKKFDGYVIKPGADLSGASQTGANPCEWSEWRGSIDYEPIAVG
jgi:hypothetical protein